jgi:hypothetical protein
VLILVQVALVFLLFFKLESHEDRLDEILRSTLQIDQNEPNAKPVTLPSEDNIIDGQPGPDSQQLRLIIREELAAAFDKNEMMARNATPTQEPPVYDEVEMQYRRELVLEEMQALKDQIEVSSGDLERLMGDIAKLNPENRTELFKMLNQALNRGEIKGHL